MLCQILTDSVAVQGDVTFEKPLFVNDTEGVGIQMLEENGILLSTKDFPPLRSITFKDNVRVRNNLISLIKLKSSITISFSILDQR